MTNRIQQSKDDYLSSKFLALGLICSKDFANGASDHFIPLSSVKSILGKESSTPVCSPITSAYPYTKKDNVITVKDFVNCLSRNHDSTCYILYAVNMKRFDSLRDSSNLSTSMELSKLRDLCVPNFTALVNFIEESCPSIRSSFESMTDRESCIFELRELRREPA